MVKWYSKSYEISQSKWLKILFFYKIGMTMMWLSVSNLSIFNILNLIEKNTNLLSTLLSFKSCLIVVGNTKHETLVWTRVCDKSRGRREPPDVCCTGDAIMNGLYSNLAHL